MNAHVGLCIVKMPADSAPVSDQRFSVSALLAILSKMPNPYQLINGYLMKTKKMSSEYVFLIELLDLFCIHVTFHAVGRK